MNLALSRAAIALLVLSALAACGGDEVPTVGSAGSTVVTSPSASPTDEGLLADAPVVDVKTTELPETWPSNIPIPPGGRIDNVIDLGDRIAVTWIIPKADPMELTRAYVDALQAAGYETGESDATEDYGRGEFSNETHTVDFAFTPLTEEEFQALVGYEPQAK